MDESQRELNLEKQHDELELLQAVYPDLLELYVLHILHPHVDRVSYNSIPLE